MRETIIGNKYNIFKLFVDKFEDASHEYTGHGDSYFVSKGMHEAKNVR